MLKLLSLLIGFTAIMACGGGVTEDTDATVAAQVASTIASINNDTPTPVPTSSPAPTASPTPRPTATNAPATATMPVPVPVPTPSATPPATPTAVPTATSTPEPLTVQDIVARFATSIVQVKADGGFGTGFVIETASVDNVTYIVTADHVVADREEITVITGGGTELPATLLGRGFGRDLAMLRTEWIDAEPVVMASPSQADVGSTVVRIGFGATGELSVASGVFSALTSDERFKTQLVQTDAAVNPGDSGSPLFDDSGKVVGVVTSKLVSAAIEGVGFAVSANELLAIRSQLRSGEIVCQQEDFVHQDLRTNTFRHSEFGYEIGTVGWEFVQQDGGTAFGVVEVGGIEQWRGSRIQELVVIFDPVPKGPYESPRQFLLDRFEEIAGIDDAEEVLGAVPPVCVSGTHGVEVSIGITWDAEFDKEDKRFERWIAFIAGGNAYLLRATDWYDRFDRFEAKLDTMLYTFVP